MSPRVDSAAAKDITIHLSPDGTTVEGITPNDLALVERQTDLRVIDIEEEVRTITADAAAIHESISGLIIRDDADMQKMNGLMNRAKDAVTQAEKITNPVRSFLNNLHKKACNIGSGSIKTLKEDAKFADGRMKDYAREQKAVDDARRISDAAIAKENAERERAALEDNAAKQREADRLRELGRISEAKALAAVPAVAPIAMPQVQVIPRSAPKLAGTNQKWKFKGKVRDKIKTLRAIADGTIQLTYINVRGEPEDLMDINETLLNFLATQRQEDLGIPGCESELDPQFARSRS